jgi:hypothetical protein
MIGDILVTKENKTGYYAIDLDDSLAKYTGPSGNTEIGDPNPEIVGVAHYLHELGYEVRLFTARCGFPSEIDKIEKWLEKYNLSFMIITNVKMHGMICLLDDRACNVKDGKVNGEILMEYK